jgi:hypothetical protein
MSNRRPAQPLDHGVTGQWTRLEADRAFTAASRARRRAAVLGRVRGLGRAVCGLPVYDEAVERRSGPRGVSEIPLEAIAGTTEPNRAAQFDEHFRPKPLTRGRWERLWLAVQQGVTLPPVSVVPSATPTRSVTAITAFRWPRRAAR